MKVSYWKLTLVTAAAVAMPCFVLAENSADPNAAPVAAAVDVRSGAASGAIVAADKEPGDQDPPPRGPRQGRLGPARSGPGGPKLEKDTFLGVGTKPVSEDVRAQLKLPAATALTIDEVAADSPAAKAGVKKFDVLTKVDDQLIVNPEQLSVLIRMHKPGDEVKLSVIHESALVTVSATLAEMELPALEDRPFGGRDGADRSFGLMGRMGGWMRGMGGPGQMGMGRGMRRGFGMGGPRMGGPGQMGMGRGMQRGFWMRGPGAGGPQMGGPGMDGPGMGDPGQIGQGRGMRGGFGMGGPGMNGPEQMRMDRGMRGGFGMGGPREGGPQMGGPGMNGGPGQMGMGRGMRGGFGMGGPGAGGPQVGGPGMNGPGMQGGFGMGRNGPMGGGQMQGRGEMRGTPGGPGGDDQQGPGQGPGPRGRRGPQGGGGGPPDGGPDDQNGPPDQGGPPGGRPDGGPRGRGFSQFRGPGVRPGTDGPTTQPSNAKDADDIIERLKAKRNAELGQ